jgi:hypothetical protein
VSPGSEHEENKGLRRTPRYVPGTTTAAGAGTAVVPDCDGTDICGELPTVEALNLHPEDRLPPVTYTDEHET